MKRSSSSRAVTAESSTTSSDSKRSMNGVIERRIKTLQKLIVPNNSDNYYNSINGGGLDGLFGETADYIKCLQMKVEIMQIMINLLSPSDH
ncbi:hypothetical protein Ddye_019478 [Dipteronia dyeriana]|uniref:BHLH transcription factor n=1 Tax=Dipteronia dyeriana TaxID=168575 RepID=A0AAD9WVP0_9ROSI|nr:hypothetical protein Ddye_019478 [Dipteronia dyeriana]